MKQGLHHCRGSGRCASSGEMTKLPAIGSLWLKPPVVHARSIHVPPCVANTCVVRPFLHGWWGHCGQQIHANFQGAMQQMLVRGHNLYVLDEAGSRAPAAPATRKPGQSAHAESTQGSFPEKAFIQDEKSFIQYVGKGQFLACAPPKTTCPTQRP